MKKIERVFRRKERGQTMAVVALLLGLGVLMGLVALAVDGGSIYLQRRFMQNSSNAGTLAGIRLMSERVIITGGTSGGYPTYALTDTLLLDTVLALAQQNRGGAVGATDADYDVVVYYHRDNGSFDTTPVTRTGGYVPDHVDGIKVVSLIRNPTIFARALPSPIQNVPVSAAAAMAIFPTCRPQPAGGPGENLPFTRFRYNFEQELPTSGNNLCAPFIYWNSQADIGGPANNNFKNILSFNTRSFYVDANPQNTNRDTEQQLLSRFDHRHWNDGSSGLPDPVDMRGSAQANDVDARFDIDWWIRYEWQGQIMTNTNRLGDPNVLGDWAETFSGNGGNNVQSPLLDVIQRTGSYTPISAPWPQGLNWGRAITRTVYLWGEGTPDSNNQFEFSAQKSREVCTVDGTPNGTPCSCSATNCIRVGIVWDYVPLRLLGNGTIRADETIQRVRFTDAVQMVFYENVNGGTSQAKCPDGTNVPSSNNSSQARGILPSAILPGPPPNPPPGGCGWMPGAGVYYRSINP